MPTWEAPSPVHRACGAQRVSDFTRPPSQPERGAVGLEARSLTGGSVRLWAWVFLKYFFFFFLVEKAVEDSSCVSPHFQ